MSKVYKINDALVVKELSNGSVGVLPTDTVYGLAALAANPQAVVKLYNLKQRDQKPGTVIAASVDQLVDLGLKRRYLKAVESYWPNAISIIIPCHELSYVHLGKGSIAVRIPADSHLLKLLEKTGALLTSSANLPGEPEATDVQQAKDYFGEKVDFYVEGGDLSGRQPSTVIRIVDDAVEVVREGAVNINEETGKIL